MSNTHRRAARNQSLPEGEANLLPLLSEDERNARSRQLFQAGWTLRAIGEAFDPPRSRSTVRSWILRAYHTAEDPDIPTPTPTLATPPEYIPRKPASPGISPADQTEIARLAPIARNYRSNMPSTNPATEANLQLTALTLDLHARHVSVQELADAAGVTYRAMARRLGKISKV